jgi:hypothetical protein
MSPVVVLRPEGEVQTMNLGEALKVAARIHRSGPILYNRPCSPKEREHLISIRRLRGRRNIYRSGEEDR